MRFYALFCARKLSLASAAIGLISLASISLIAQPDPPAEAGRIAYITGNVNIQPAGVDDWGQAIPNLPIGPGGRISTDADGRAEVQVGQTFVRIGPNSDVTLINSTPQGLYFGVAAGSVHIRVRGLWDGQAVYVNTPSGSAAEATPGEMRIDVLPQQDATLFTPFDGGNIVQITGAGGFEQQIWSGQALELAGSNPVVPQWLGVSEFDDLDRWSRARDQQIANAASYQYVSPEIPGAYELDAAGSWTPGTPYGAIWFPNNVPGGWAPYHNGHWINRSPWGWVWVEDESWGYAPFHYGRWVSFNGRWGWIPGPPAAHPIWSPALVVFAGGQPGVSAWFALGPGEPYRPWYPCSPRYVDQVNVTNIIEAPRVHVQTTYVNINVVNVTYINRTSVIAVNNNDFASGRPVAQAHVNVNVNINVNEHVQVLAAPEPRPTAASFTGRPPVRPVPVSAARPVLINENGMAVAAAPNARPVPPPVKAAPVIKPLPGHTVVAPPAGAASRPQPGGKPAQQMEKPESKPVPEAKPMTEAPKPAPAPRPMTEAPKPAPAAWPVPAEKPVVPEAAKPVVKPAPETAKPAPPAPAKPADATTPAKPATTPPAKTDKDKTDKDKKNDKNKDKDKDEKKPE